MSSILSPTIIEIIQAGLIRYFSITLLIFGTFGNTLNIYVFTRPKLRLIPCSWYFLASTCSSLIALYMGCLTRVLISFNHYPRTEQGTSIYCKIRTYLTYANLSLSIWLVIGACVDRWASSCTSVRIRSLSSVKIAKKVIIGMILMVYFIYSQMLYCFAGIFQSSSANCVPISDACAFYNDAALFSIYSLLPVSLMLIFGLATIRNIRQTRQNIAPSLRPRPSNQNTRKTTKQMTVMLLVQVVCSVLLSLPVSLEKIYSVLSEHQIKSIEQQQLGNFLDTFFVLITLVNSSSSFYIFTLTGEIFRKELKRLFCFKFGTFVAPITTQSIIRVNVHLREKMQKDRV